MAQRRHTTQTQLPICSDKYEVVRFLGSGSFCRVYLVRHKSLSQERALKIYPKDQFPAASELMEAQLLKSLNHPCIPRIYDLDQDSENFYLYEEFIHGETLDQFLLQQSHISEQFYYGFFDQLCSTFIYLHHDSPLPVLYRDLKPEHIILRGTHLYLIDFGASSSADQSGNNQDHLGNQTFSSPESFTDSDISFSSDVYSIGMLMKYLSSHLAGRPPRPLRAIIQKATAQDPVLRYETVEALSCDLKQSIKQNSHPHLRTSIAVAGSHPGCGTTHLAFSMVSVLNFLGISAVYYEKNNSNSLRNAAESDPFFVEHLGSLYYHFFHGVPLYGPGIIIPRQESEIQVFDYGSDFTPSDLSSHDLVIIVSTGAIWRRAELLVKAEMLKRETIPVCFVCNLSTIKQTFAISRLLKARCWRYAPDPDPFHISRKKIRFFLQLLHI